LVVVRPTRCFPAQRGWELGKHASARTSRVPSDPGRTQSRLINDWVSFTHSKFVLSSVAILSPIVLTQHVPNSQSPDSVHARSTRTRIHKRMSDMSESQKNFVHAVDGIGRHLVSGRGSQTTVRSRYKRIVYKRIRVASLAF